LESVKCQNRWGADRVERGEKREVGKKSYRGGVGAGGPLEISGGTKDFRDDQRNSRTKREATNGSSKGPEEAGSIGNETPCKTPPKKRKIKRRPKNCTKSQSGSSGEPSKKP